ncbi:MAG: PEP-CTERM sorting domain-containing protein [Planctomycetia bacterium]|nr:PEP-CTERM sorting domain-containing protein [Planctomycetia bacterium]
MLIRRLSMVVFVAVAVALLAGNTALATIIDDFSADTSSDYNVYTIWAADPPATATYARNASEQFVPTFGETGAVFGFLRNTGETLAAGQRVSIEVDAGTLSPANSHVGGLTLNTSLDGTGTNIRLGLFKYWYSPTYRLEYANSSTEYINIGDDLSGMVTLTLTREAADPTKFDYSVSGGGLATPVTGTKTESAVGSGSVYFGMMAQSGTSLADPQVAMDNLTLVPEPGTLALLVSGLIGMLLYARRKRA